MGYATLRGMNAGASKLFLRDILAKNALHDSRAGEEHVGGVLYHDSEISQCWGVYRSAGAGTEYSGNLRHNTGSEDIPLEYLTVAGEGVDTFLDPGSTRIVQADERSPISGCQIKSLAYLFRHCFGKRAAGYGEILCGDIDQPAANRSHSGHDTVPIEMLFIHSEIDATMLDEHVELLETALVEQQSKSLSSC